jgi:hypothetical protein
MTEEVIGTFKIEQTPAKYGGYRTVVIDEQGKQVGSTFDDDVGNKLAGYPEGAVVAVDVDKSGRFWEIARLANGSQAKASSTSTSARPAARESSGVTFPDDKLTYFCGNAARVVAAYLAASKEYVDQVENTENPIETLHKDVIYGAKLLLNEANRKG